MEPARAARGCSGDRNRRLRFAVATPNRSLPWPAPPFPAIPGRDAYRSDPTYAAPAAVRRISWGAIVAGIVVVLVVQLLLMLLGLAIGTATIDPAAAGTPDASTLGIGGGVWWLVATAISVFAGAWVAGRLAGMPTPPTACCTASSPGPRRRCSASIS